MAPPNFTSRKPGASPKQLERIPIAAERALTAEITLIGNGDRSRLLDRTQDAQVAHSRGEYRVLLLLHEAREEKGHLHGLFVVEAGIELRPVVTLEISLRDAARTPHALRHVVASQLEMHAP